MQINVKKTYWLVIDNDIRRREQKLALFLTINGESLQAMNFDDACRYLGYLGNGKQQYESNQGSGQAKDHCST